ncbi:MAG: hypothetical protein Q9201_000145 [Fulgogasparrea decipioides]
MPDDTYIFGRGYLTATRLNLQHFLWKETLDYILHPSVPVGENEAAIADVGTGTAIWLLDLAKSLPSTVQLDGFDISAKQYPAMLPRNVSLHVANALEDPPADRVGAYDIVHIRLFMGVVNDNNPVPLFDHCAKLLKPGGYLQWDEYDLSAQEIVSAQPSLPTDELSEMSRGFQTRRQTREHGFESLVVDARRPSSWYGKMSTELDCMLREEFARTVLDQKGPPGSGDKAQEQIQASDREVAEGSYISNLLQVVVGKKPLGASAGGITAQSEKMQTAEVTASSSVSTRDAQ